MICKTLSSGSSGNCYLLWDSKGSQIILEVGIKFESIITELQFDKPMFALISHLSHKDHSFSVDKIKRSGITVYDETNLTVGKQITINDFVILPIPAYHNVPCMGFIIYSKADKKKCLFITDTEKIPNIADTNIDLALIECNYSIEQVIENADKLSNKGFNSHLSQEYLISWLERRQHKPKNLVLIHLSGSGNLVLDGLTERFSPFAENVHIATKGKIIEI